MCAAKNVVMIDNYDSFTWNIYEYLCQEGANVTVFRNDKITVEEIASLKPEILVISPGPGHPITDSGISRDCIRYFAGKIPVMGVCMGQQCMIDVFGGEIAYAGEIVHGKTSAIHHDGKGIFENVSQDIVATRYHSLAGSMLTLPKSLEVTAKTDSGVIMGVRHKELVVEGVQFHPESILTEQGHQMIRNMLNMEGGTWAENADRKKQVSNRSGSILDKIYNKRRTDVLEQSKIPGLTMRDLESNLELGLAPKILNLYEKLLANKYSVLAEIKRASPSKGDICPDAIAAKQALKYAVAGATAISVLTEPHWFKGNLQDLVNVRKVLDKKFELNPQDRPCLLRKEFIFSKYQILEARLSGADTVLLIVKMLSQQELIELYDYSTNVLGMEPLVEINSQDELDRALSFGAKVIGVNNRDLHSFNVDLNTTSNLASNIPKGTILIALSGITNAQDADNYKKQGVHGFLVGEALMKTNNVESLIHALRN